MGTNKQLKGSMYIALSSFFFGTYGVWARLIGASLGNLFQVWVRSLLILLIIIPIALLTRSLKPIKSSHIKWIALYAGAGAFTVAPIFYAYNIIGIGPATLLFYASLTIVSYISGVISFRENMTLVKIGSLLLALVGLCLVFSISFTNNALIATLAAVIAGCAAGIEVTYTKKVSSYYSPLQLSIFTWGIIFVSHLILSKVLGESWVFITINIAWLGVLGYAIASLCAFFFVILGFKYSEPSVASIVGLLEIIFGIAFGVVFFHESLTLTLVIGSLLIIVAAALPNIKDILAHTQSKHAL